MKNLFPKIVLLTVIAVIIGCGSPSKGAKKESDRDRMKLSSDVLNTRTTKYKAQDSFGNIQKTEFVSDELLVFNKDGNMEEQYLFDTDGKPTFKAWKEKGEYIDSAISISSKGFMMGKYVYENDENGNRLVHSHFTPDGALTYKYTNSFDSNGNLTEVTHYSADGSVSNKVFYSYDSDNRKTGERRVDGTGKLTSRSEYEYDSHDGKVKLGNNYSALTEYDGNDIPQLEREFAYDTWGNCTMELVDNYKNETKFETAYKYDEKGNWTSVTTKRNGVVIELIERKFNVDIPENLKTLQKTTTPDKRMPKVTAATTNAGFPPENLLDGNPATAWIVNHDDSGHLGSMFFTFDEPRDIDIVVISPGYAKDDESWTSYGRLTSLFVDYPNNTQGWIMHKLGANLKKHIIPIHRKGLTSLEIILGEMEPGTKSQELAISDVWFY